jgi:hypothetical protein
MLIGWDNAAGNNWLHLNYSGRGESGMAHGVYGVPSNIQVGVYG